MTPVRWYIVFWLLGGIVGLAPMYWLLWRIVRAVETVEFILSLKK